MSSARQGFDYPPAENQALNYGYDKHGNKHQTNAQSGAMALLKTVLIKTCWLRTYIHFLLFKVVGQMGLQTDQQSLIAVTRFWNPYTLFQVFQEICWESSSNLSFLDTPIRGCVVLVSVVSFFLFFFLFFYSRSHLLIDRCSCDGSRPELN